MKYTLNPYTIISNVEDSFTFMGKANKTVTADLNGSQKQLLGELSKGSFLESELLKSSFGEELYSSLIENASLVATEPDTTSYTSRTYAFYNTFGMDNAAKILSDKRVLVLGCGGIGTHLAWHLLSMGVGHITLLDFDTVEVSNLNRQLLFDSLDAGQKKTEVLKNKLLRIKPDADIKTIDLKIDSPKTLDGVCCASQYDLIIKALDTPLMISHWVDEVCKLRHIPYISGITARESVLIGPTYIPGRYDSGWTDLVPASMQGSRYFGTSPSLGMMLYHISDEIATEAFKVLTGYGTPKYGNKVVARNIFTNEESTFGGSSDKASADMQPKAGQRKAFLLGLLLILCTSIASISAMPFAFVSVALSLALPWLIYNSGKEITKSTLIYSMLSSLALLIINISKVSISVGISSFLATIVMYFGISSIAVLVCCMINAALTRLKHL